MKPRFIHILFVFCLPLIVGCYYDNEEDLYGMTDCDTANVTYSAFVRNTIEQSCFACHSAASNFGGVTLEGYEAVKVYVDNGRLLGAIRHEAGFSSMPQGAPKLSDCIIDRLQAWIDDGALNN